MDVHCSSCREPWDIYHLRHDAVYETGMGEAKIEAWKKLPESERLKGQYRQEFKDAGWEFGRTTIVVHHCPCCPKGMDPDEEVVELKGILESLMGNDIDGLAAALEDQGL